MGQGLCESPEGSSQRCPPVCWEVGTASLGGLLGRGHQAGTAPLCEALFVLYAALTPVTALPGVQHQHPHTEPSCNRAEGCLTSETLPETIAAQSESAGLCLPGTGLPKTLT